MPLHLLVCILNLWNRHAGLISFCPESPPFSIIALSCRVADTFTNDHCDAGPRHVWICLFRSRGWHFALPPCSTWASLTPGLSLRLRAFAKSRRLCAGWSWSAVFCGGKRAGSAWSSEGSRKIDAERGISWQAPAKGHAVQCSESQSATLFLSSIVSSIVLLLATSHISPPGCPQSPRQITRASPPFCWLYHLSRRPLRSRYDSLGIPRNITISPYLRSCRMA